MPAACCEAHSQATQHDECADDCPMHHTAPQPDDCPLHHSVDATPHAAAPAHAADDCTIGGLCQVPAASLSVLLGSPAVIPAPVTFGMPAFAGTLAPSAGRITTAFRPLDLPPPRA